MKNVMKKSPFFAKKIQNQDEKKRLVLKTKRSINWRSRNTISANSSIKLREDAD
jgi:hypothetical protein